MKLSCRQLLAVGAAFPISQPAWADTWPIQTIKVIVPFPVGGSTDILGRLVAEQLQKQLGNPCLLGNLPGGTVTTGADVLARAKPDGHTLLMGSVGTMVTNHFVYEGLRFGIDAIAPVIHLAETPNVLMVRENLEVNTPKELVELLKAQPGKYHYGSSGIASSSHISCELFKLCAGVDAMHVPYRGGAPMLTDLMGGIIDFSIDQISSSLKLIQADRIKALAVTSRARSKQLPDLPTLSESLLPGFVAAPEFCVEAPAGTPQLIVPRINRALNNMLADPTVLVWKAMAFFRWVVAPRISVRSFSVKLRKWESCQSVCI